MKLETYTEDGDNVLSFDFDNIEITDCDTYYQLDSGNAIFSFLRGTPFIVSSTGSLVPWDKEYGLFATFREAVNRAFLENKRVLIALSNTGKPIAYWVAYSIALVDGNDRQDYFKFIFENNSVELFNLKWQILSPQVE